MVYSHRQKRLDEKEGYVSQNKFPLWLLVVIMIVIIFAAIGTICLLNKKYNSQTQNSVLNFY
jgi:hypothetical protein